MEKFLVDFTDDDTDQHILENDGNVPDRNILKVSI